MVDARIGVGVGIGIEIERQVAMASDCKRARGGTHPNGHRAARRVDADTDTDSDSDMLRRGPYTGNCRSVLDDRQRAG